MRGLKILLLSALIAAASYSYAQYVQPMGYKDYSFWNQVNIGNNGAKLTHSSAFLELGKPAGSLKGLLFPRGNKDSIQNPAKGLFFYDLPSDALVYYNGTSWLAVSSPPLGYGIIWSNNSITVDTSKIATLASRNKLKDSLVNKINGWDLQKVTDAGSVTTNGITASSLTILNGTSWTFSTPGAAKLRITDLSTTTFRIDLDWSLLTANRSLYMPNENDTLATRGWVRSLGFGGGGGTTYTNGYGLDLTSNIFSADTLVLSTKEWRQKGIDSLGALISTKLSNITGLITAGTNVTITGSGTSGSPYVINASGSGGGASAINDLTDVTITSIANNQLLKYNTGTSQWENWTPNYLTSFTESDPTAVHLTGAETIAGLKTFSSRITGSADVSATSFHIHTSTGTMSTPSGAGVFYIKNDGLPYVKNAAGTEMPLYNATGITSETDPIFSASAAFGITSGNITTWNAAVPGSRTITINGTAQDLTANRTWTLTTSDIAEGTNLYFTDARARAAISLTTTGTSGAATYNSTTGVLNIPQYTGSGGTGSEYFIGNVLLSGFDTTIYFPAYDTTLILGKALKVEGINSIDVDNSQNTDSSNHYVIQLLGDLATPGNSKYYGTDGTGTKGWYSLPAGGSSMRFGFTGEDATAAENRTFALGTNTFRINGTNSSNYFTLYTLSSATRLEHSATDGTTTGSFASTHSFQAFEINNASTSSQMLHSIDGLRLDKPITLKEIAAPGTPATNYGTVYVKTDGKIYFKNDGGTEYDLTATGAGGLSGLTAGRMVYATSSTTIGDNSSFTYNQPTNSMKFLDGSISFLTAGDSVNLSTQYNSLKLMFASTAGSFLLGGLNNDVHLANLIDGEMKFFTNAGELQMILNNGAAGGISFSNYGSGTYTGTATSWLAVTANGTLIEMSAPAGTTYTFTESLTESGGTVKLVNDATTPGNSMYYGTNGAGSKGWYALPAGSTPQDLEDVLTQGNTASLNIITTGDVEGANILIRTGPHAATISSNNLSGAASYELVDGGGTLALVSQIPTNNSGLTNGAGYITNLNNFLDFTQTTPGNPAAGKTRIYSGSDKSLTIKASDGIFMTLTGTNTATAVYTFPNTASGVVVLDAALQSLTNKTINLSSNTFITTLSQLNTAVSDADLASLAGAEIFTNKTIDHDNNTVTNVPRKAGISIVSPTASEQISLFQVPAGGGTAVSGFITLRGTSPSVTYAIHFGTTYGTSTGTIRSSTTVNTTGATTITITTAAIPANAYVWLATTATSGTVDEFTVHLNYKY